MPARPAAPVPPSSTRRVSNRETLLRPRKKPVQGRSRVTVDAILEAAARLFVRDGYPNTTTNRIAELAGVSVGSLYEYFPNKASILLALLQRQVDSTLALMRERYGAVHGKPLDDVVRAIARTAIEAHYKELALNRILIASMTRVAHWRHMEKVSFTAAEITRDALVHLVGDPVRLEHAAFTVETLVEGLLHRTILFAHRLPGYPLEEEMVAVLAGYLSPLTRT